MKLFTQVGLGWLGRRVLDWGGWIGGFAGILFAIYSGLDAESQRELGGVLERLFTGQWREITLGHVATIGGMVMLIWSQRKSYKATVKPQIVTEEGERADPRVLPSNKRVMVEEVAKTAVEVQPDGPVLRALKRMFGR